jgi:hypothetical protein
MYECVLNRANVFERDTKAVWLFLGHRSREHVVPIAAMASAKKT